METDDPTLPPLAPLFEGTRIAGCRIGRLIGTGGQGNVYLAHHENLDKDVAIKVLAPSLATDPDFLRRFVREARAAAKLDHPNIVQIHDAGSESGTHYIVMQYVEGRDLDSVLEKKGKVEVKDALSIGKRVALALGTAHKVGIVHRDVKPSNIMITKQGKVLIMDFGLARDNSGTVTGTMSGEFIMGTPDYLSPEQSMGERVDARSDIYSLGATLYRMLAGQPPYPDGDAMAVMMKHARENEHPAPLRSLNPDVPPALEALIAKMMSKNPAHRFQTMEEVAAAIDAVKGVPVTTRAETTSPDAPPRRNVWRYVFAGAVLGAAALILLAIMLRPDPNILRLQEIERAYPTRPFHLCSAEIREILDRTPSPKVETRARELLLNLSFQRLAEIERSYPTRLFSACAADIREVLNQRPPEDAERRAREILLTLSRREIMVRARRLVELAQARKVNEIVELLDPEEVGRIGLDAARFRVGLVVGLASFNQTFDIALHENHLWVDMEKQCADLAATITTQKKNGKTDSDEATFRWKLAHDDWFLDTEKR